MKLTLNKNCLNYLAVVIAVLGMGSLYFQVLRMPLMAVMLLTVAFLYLIKKPTLNRRNAYLYMALTAAFIFTSIVNFSNGFSLNDVIIWLVDCFYVMVLQSNMSFGEFKKKYVVVMTVEAVVSLICFLWVNILGGSIPLMSLESNSVNSYYLTPYYTAGWGNVGIFSRNAGMFTEPGAHQIFLNFALIFLLADNEKMGFSKKKYLLISIILVGTILTTQSTTGYMCLAVVLISAAVKKTSGEKNTNLKIFVVIAITVLLVIESQFGIIEDKFAGLETGQTSAKTRYNDTFYGYYIAFMRPIFGHGMYMTNISDYLSEYGIVNSSNGLTGFAIRAGIVITVIVLILMYRSIKKKFPLGILFNICMFIVWFMCVNSEGLFLNILFIAFWGNWLPEIQDENAMEIQLTL